MKLSSVLISSITLASSAFAFKSLDCIVHDFKVIDEEVKSLTVEVQSFCHHGSILHDTAPLVCLERDVKDLEGLVEDTIEDIRDLCPLNDEQTLKLASSVLEIVDPIINLIWAVENKRCVFDHAVLGHLSASPLIKGELKALRCQVEELVLALRCKISPNYVSLLDSEADKILKTFDHAIWTTYRDVHCREHC